MKCKYAGSIFEVIAVKEYMIIQLVVQLSTHAALIIYYTLVKLNII